MKINSRYVVVRKVAEPKGEGFQAVEIQDSFIVKGEVIKLPSCPALVDDHQLVIGDIVLFQKYSPDTMETELDGEKVKFISVSDLLAVI